jgi:hypothetical protein
VGTGGGHGLALPGALDHAETDVSFMFQLLVQIVQYAL